MRKLVSLVLALALALSLGGFAGTAGAEEEPLTIHVMTISHVTAPINTDMITFQAIEEKFNVNFEFELVVQADYDAKLNVVLASDEMPDVFYGSTSIMSQYYDTGIVRVLDDLLSEHGQNILNVWDSHGVTRNVKSDDGHFYYLPTIDESSDLECCGWMNMDMMAACGIESVPTTYEELYENLKAFQDFYGADSDYIPMSNGPWYTVDSHVWTAYQTAKGWVYYNDADGYVFGPYHYQEQTKAALRLMHKLYSEGLLDAEYLTRDSDSINALAAEGKIGYFVTWADHASAIAPGGAYGCNYDVVLALETELGTKGVGAKNAVSLPMYISAAASDEVAVKFVQIVDYMFSDEGAFLFDFGVEGVTYNLVDGLPVLTEAVTESELGELNGRRSFGMECQGFPHLATWEGWASVLWDCTVEVTEANAPYVRPQQPSLSGTYEEEAELANIMTDISTYVSTTLTQFIVGELDVDTDWDAFISQLENMGIERASEIQAEKFARWLER